MLKQLYVEVWKYLDNKKHRDAHVEDSASIKSSLPVHTKQ